MKPQDQFAAFKDLQELTSASDNDLAAMLARDCGPIGEASYEDDLCMILCRWLRYITGVEWVRAFQEGARPKDRQYGTIFIIGFEPIMAGMLTQQSRINPETNEPYLDQCETSHSHGKYTIQLDVYRDDGVGNRQQDDVASTKPIGSALDVLTRLMSRMKFGRVMSALEEYCIYYTDDALSSIRNLPPQKIKSTFETRATATLEIIATPVSRMRLTNTNDVPVDIAECVDFKFPE